MMQNLTAAEIEALSKAIGTSYVGKSHPSESAAQMGSVKNQQETFPTGPASASYAQFSQLTKEEVSENASRDSQGNLKDLELRLDVVLGRTKMSIDKLLKIQLGTVVRLDKLAGEPVEIEANGKVIAKGEVVVLEDNFGIKIIQIID